MILYLKFKYRLNELVLAELINIDKHIVPFICVHFAISKLLPLR